MKSREVLQQLQREFPRLDYYGLHRLVYSGRVPPPPKDISGDFRWAAGDIRRARRVLTARAKRYQRPRGR